MSVHHVSRPFSFPFSSLIRPLCPFAIKMLFQLSTAYYYLPTHTSLIKFRRGKNLHLRVALAVALQPIVLWEIGYRSWIQRTK
jgi:hypothetical protein